MKPHRIPLLATRLVRPWLAAALGVCALACSTPAPDARPESTTRAPLTKPPEPTTDASAEADLQATGAEPDGSLEADAPGAPDPGHDMRQRSNEQIDEVPLEKRPAGIDCDRCAHVMIGTQSGTKHRCLRANPERAGDPGAPRRVSCDDRCCPDME